MRKGLGDVDSLPSGLENVVREVWEPEPVQQAKQERLSESKDNAGYSQSQAGGSLA